MDKVIDVTIERPHYCTHGHSYVSMPASIDLHRPGFPSVLVKRRNSQEVVRFCTMCGSVEILEAAGTSRPVLNSSGASGFDTGHERRT